MFGNRIAYTSGPGGIRRGLIWQSGTGAAPVIPDQRWLLFNPYMETGTLKMQLGSEIIDLPNGGEVTDTSGFYGLVGMRIPLEAGSPVSLHCPEYIYIPTTDVDGDGNTFITAWGDENSYYVDLDFYVNCGIASVGGTAMGYSTPNWDGDASTLGDLNVVGGRNQIPNSCKPYNRGYYIRSAGEVKNTPSTVDGYYNSLAHDRLAYPGCPMRVKMRVVVSDYPFALSSSYTGGTYSAIELPVSTIRQYFDDILDAYTVPSDDTFGGSTIESLDYGGFYDDLGFPTFENVYADRVEYNGSSPTATGLTAKRYRYTSGIYYTGLGKAFQMVLSPVMYPAVSRISQDTGSTYQRDSYMYLPPQYDSTTAGKIAAFGQHASPYWIPPVVSFPYLQLIRFEDRGYDYVTNLTYGNSGNVWNYSGGDRGSNSFATIVNPFIKSGNFPGSTEDDVLIGSGLHNSAISGWTAPTVTYNNILGYYTPPAAYGNPFLRLNPKSFLQPRIQIGGQYIREFRSTVMLYNGSRTTESGYGACGRVKYMGIKGKVSFFEI